MAAAVALLAAAAATPVVVLAAPADQTPPGLSLGDTLNSAVRNAIDSKPGATLAEMVDAAQSKPPFPSPLDLQTAVEGALENALVAAKASADDASAALDFAETALRRDGLFTAPVEAAFRTARAAVAAQKAKGPGAGFGGTPGFGAVPSVSGGGGSQTGTYAQPQN